MNSESLATSQLIYSRVIDIVVSTDSHVVEQVKEQLLVLPDGEAKEVLNDAFVRALQARQEFGKLRRRESELQVLFDTASDLSSLRSSDEVLEAVATRVRRLFGADAGYLALVDEETGEAYMRITSGTVTPAIGSVRLRPGLGVGGSIIKTGRPFVTDDYFNDPHIQHDPYVSEAVRADGIQSIAGAPITLGSKTIGALFVASRASQRYEASDIALLTSLANHVAILIENSRLFESQQDSSQALEQANNLLTAERAELQNLTEFHNLLAGLVLERTSRQYYAEISSATLRAAVVYVDESGMILASAGDDESVRNLLHLAKQRGTSAFPRAQQLVEHDEHAWWVAIRAGSSHFGNMLFMLTEPPSAATTQLLELAAQTAALLELTERRSLLAEEQLRRELLGDLLANRPTDWVQLSRRAETSGLSILTTPQRILILSSPSDAPLPQLAEVCSRIAAAAGGLAAEYTNDVVLVLPEQLFADGQRNYITDLQFEIQRRLGSITLTGGLAGPGTSGPYLRELYQEAHRYLRIAHALNMEDQIVDKATLGPLGLVLESTSRPLVDAMLEQKIGPLRRYDNRHDALLLPTLQAYFEAGQNPRAASAALFVHPNTVYQRLTRISQILGNDDWREPRGSLEMQLALQFYEVLNSTRDDVIPPNNTKSETIAVTPGL